MASSPNITILSDNCSGIPGLTTVWGFSALIRAGNRTVLFDTGSNGRVLVQNMAALGVDAAEVELVFFSHIHWDHIGGMDSIIELNPHATVVVHEGFSKHLIADLRAMCDKLVVVGKDPVELLPGFTSTGVLPADTPEQSLVLDVDGVTAVISGCAHPGIETIAARAVQISGKRLDWVIGGFHLMYSDDARIQRTIDALKNLGVDRVVPTHCTGDLARAAFRESYGDRVIAGGVGRVVNLRC